MSRRAGLMVLVAALLVGWLPSAHPDDSVPVRPPVEARLATHGRVFTDAHGRFVLLHGVNNVDKEGPWIQPGDGFTITAEDAALLAGHGFNTVRLGVAFEAIMPAPGQIDEAYLDRVVSVVDVLGAAGIHVLLDNHQDSMSRVFRGGNGFPAWAVDPKPLPFEIDIGWPLNSGTMVSLNLAWTNFWNNTYGVVDHLADALAAVATRVRGKAAVLGIEVMNEPWPGVVFPTCFPLGCVLFDKQYQGVHQKITDRIRQADPDVNVFWEPNTTWNFGMPTHMAAPPLTPALTSPGVVFSFHDYCGFSQAGIYLGIGQQLRGICPLQHEVQWANADAFAARTNVPALVTEFGDSDVTVMANTLVRADARFVGWQYWHYTSVFGPQPKPDPFAGEIGRQLVRTYPQATAGTPGSMSYEPATGEFRYHYQPKALGMPTEIYVSDVQYPDGYRVEVDGACVTSAPGDRILTLMELPGAPSVDVHITNGTGPWPSCAQM